MKSLNSIFIATINQNRESEDLLSIIKELSFELSRKKIQRLKDDVNIQNRLSELFEFYIKDLDTENLKNLQTISAVIEGLLKAASFDKEEFLYKTIYEKDQLDKAISEQKNAIKNTIQGTYDTLENHIKKIDDSLKEDALKALNDVQLRGVTALGILKETTTEAILTTIEKSIDIEDTVLEITKNITYQAINEGSFTKHRFIDITKTILEATIEIADEDQSHAKELLRGCIHGTNEGMAKAINRFRDNLKFAPEELSEILELDLNVIKKDLIEVEDAFVVMVKESKPSSPSPSSKIISEILENDLDNTLSKFKRITLETRESISEKLKTLKVDVNQLETNLIEKAEKKIAELKADMNKVEKKAGKKFEELKKDVKNFEFENQKAKKAAVEAKKLGNHAWEVAKNALDNAVKNAKKVINKEK